MSNDVYSSDFRANSADFESIFYPLITNRQVQQSKVLRFVVFAISVCVECLIIAFISLSMSFFTATT